MNHLPVSIGTNRTSHHHHWDTQNPWVNYVMLLGSTKSSLHIFPLIRPVLVSFFDNFQCRDLSYEAVRTSADKWRIWLCAHWILTRFAVITIWQIYADWINLGNEYKVVNFFLSFPVCSSVSLSGDGVISFRRGVKLFFTRLLWEHWTIFNLQKTCKYKLF